MLEVQFNNFFISRMAFETNYHFINDFTKITENQAFRMKLYVNESI